MDISFSNFGSYKKPNENIIKETKEESINFDLFKFTDNNIFDVFSSNMENSIIKEAEEIIDFQDSKESFFQLSNEKLIFNKKNFKKKSLETIEEFKEENLLDLSKPLEKQNFLNESELKNSNSNTILTKNEKQYKNGSKKNVFINENNNNKNMENSKYLNENNKNLNINESNNKILINDDNFQQKKESFFTKQLQTHNLSLIDDSLSSNGITQKKINDSIINSNTINSIKEIDFLKPKKSIFFATQNPISLNFDENESVVNNNISNPSENSNIPTPKNVKSILKNSSRVQTEKNRIRSNTEYIDAENSLIIEKKNNKKTISRSTVISKKLKKNKNTIKKFEDSEDEKKNLSINLTKSIMFYKSMKTIKYEWNFGKVVKIVLLLKKFISKLLKNQIAIKSYYSIATRQQTSYYFFSFLSPQEIHSKLILRDETHDSYSLELVENSNLKSIYFNFLSFNDRKQILLVRKIHFLFSETIFYICNKIYASTYFNILTLLILIFYFSLEESEKLYAENDYKSNFDKLNRKENYLFFFFCFELLVRLFAYRVKYFFINFWNIFDFVICILKINSKEDKDFPYFYLRIYTILRIIPLQQFKNILKSIICSVIFIKYSLLYLIIFVLYFGICGYCLFHDLFKQQCFHPYLGIFLTEEVCGYYQCQYPYHCFKNIKNPNFSIFNFDNFLNSLLQIFFVITLDNWKEIMFLTQRSLSMYCWIYFFCVIILGNYFFLNLILASIKIGFTKYYNYISIAEKNYIEKYNCNYNLRRLKFNGIETWQSYYKRSSFYQKNTDKKNLFKFKKRKKISIKECKRLEKTPKISKYNFQVKSKSFLFPLTSSIVKTEENLLFMKIKNNCRIFINDIANYLKKILIIFFEINAPKPKKLLFISLKNESYRSILSIEDILPKKNSFDIKKIIAEKQRILKLISQKYVIQNEKTNILEKFIKDATILKESTLKINYKKKRPWYLRKKNTINNKLNENKGKSKISFAIMNNKTTTKFRNSSVNKKYRGSNFSIINIDELTYEKAKKFVNTKLTKPNVEYVSQLSNEELYLAILEKDIRRKEICQFNWSGNDVCETKKMEYILKIFYYFNLKFLKSKVFFYLKNRLKL